MATRKTKTTEPEEIHKALTSDSTISKAISTNPLDQPDRMVV